MIGAPEPPAPDAPELHTQPDAPDAVAPAPLEPEAPELRTQPDAAAPAPPVPDAAPPGPAPAPGSAPHPAPAPPLYAQVIVDISTQELDEPFTYSVPPELAAQTDIGSSVQVDFNHRPAFGYVVGISDVLPEGLGLRSEAIKPIEAVLSTPRLFPHQLELARWMAREYLAPLSETVRLFAPPGARPRFKRDEAGDWNVEQAEVGPIEDRWVRLSDAGREYVPRANADKQRAILAALAAGELRVSELSLAVENPAASLRSLQKKGLVEVQNRRRIRGLKADLPASRDIRQLTDGQREALAAIRTGLAETGVPQPILLDGITGSGKTEVYLQAIRGVLEQGGTAIVLVPEISLTPQTVARFRSRFGELVAVLHSRLSPGERYDQWDLLRSGSARLVVGARSALFAPLQDLRLIVIDEEHESSYKQGSAPRYNSRDVALRLSEATGALLLLGSATPSMEALVASRRGQMRHVRLPERPNGRPLPPISVVDLAAEFKAGNRSMFSTELKDALLTCIDHGDKAVLLLNRRGFASFLLCRDCGFVPSCENCSTSLTYHTDPPHLLCHQCGSRHKVPAVCPVCGSVYLRQLGPGTQYAFEQLVTLLPEGTPIVRMDADSTRGRYGHEQRLEEFIAADHGVLLGTQMIAKGLDFPEVTLVGVLTADTALNIPDFRAAERTYQLLEQVAGRAGRSEKDGRVIVQTYWPEHAAIQAAAQHDRRLLLVEEGRLRKELGYPPYARLANLLFWSEDQEAVTADAEQVARQLLPILPEEVQLLGPSPCVISRRQGQFRWHIIFKAELGFGLPAWLGEALRGLKAGAGVTRAVDVDPYNMM